jgi:hypothetical protein
LPGLKYSSISNSWGKEGQFRRELAAFAWLVGFVGICRLVGFFWGTVFFMVGYGLLSTRSFLASWSSRILFVVLGTAVMGTVVFEMFALTHFSYTPLINL